MYGANTQSGLRGDYREVRSDFTVDQAREPYGEADQALWRALYARQAALIDDYACEAFARGLAQAGCADGIPELARVSAALSVASGWRLVAVPGFIPDAVFFSHLARRQFPVTVWLRRPDEFDYLVEPDLFHDFFGHVPMLFDPRFGDCMQRFGEQGLAALDADALPRLARLYWYTVEFGLVESAAGLRAYGAGLLSSGGELRYAVEDASPQRLRFEAQRCMRTRYRIDTYQKTYFVLPSFDALADTMQADLEVDIRRLETVADIEAGASIAGDVACCASPRLAA